MKKIIYIWLISILVLAQGNYYQGIDPNKNTFIQDLQTLIRSNTTVIPYDQYDETILANFESSDAGDGKRKVTCVYSGEVYVYTPPFSWGYFSREHTFCHSWMPTYSSKSGPEYSDQHHLFPTNQNKANGVRNNHPLGKVITVTSTFLECKYGKNENGKPVFEPRNSHKGDAARALLYMSLRYNGVNNKNWTFNYLNTVTLPSLGEDTQSVAILLKWHKEDPPDEWERARNDYIYSLQNNRNPFVDHPEWVDYINWYDLTYKAGAVKLALEPTNHIKNLTTSFIGDNKITITWNLPDTGTQQAKGYYIYISTDSDLQFPIDGQMYPIDTNYNDGIGKIYLPLNKTSFTFNNLEPATNYYISVFTYNGFADSINYKTDGTVPKITATTTGISLEPKFNVTDFAVERTGANYISIAWKYDSLPLPKGYFISFSNSPNKILVPQDGQNYNDDLDLSDSIGNVTITTGNLKSYFFSNLNVYTRYYFYIFPFNGSSLKNYKTDEIKSCQAYTKYVNTSELLISEYIEGGNNNQFIEIYNGTGLKANLADYTLRIYSDGSSTPTYELPLDGYLEDNTTLVIKNSNATGFQGSAISWNNLKFDGNDAISLFRKSINKDIDVVGVIGQNPGDEWKYLTSWTTKNKTLRRKSSVTNPKVNVNTFATLGTEWNYADANDLGNLGNHSINSLSNITILHKYNNSSDSLSVISKGGFWTVFPNTNIISAETGGVSTPEHSYISYDITEKIPNWQLGEEFENEWVGWMDLNRDKVSGWTSTTYNCGMVLAANSPVFNASTTQGYAIGFKYVIGESPLALFKFDNGIGTGSSLPNGSTEIISSNYIYADADNGVNFYVKLNGDGSWTIKTKKGTKLSHADAINPLNYNETSNTSSIQDNLAGQEYKYTGWVYAHNTAITSADFANLGAGMYISYNPLSIKLNYFKAYKNEKNQIVLTWQTAYENNSHSFIIERSFNTKKWDAIGFVKANINTNTNNYEFIDNNAFNKVYYRIKYVDINCNFNYLPILEYIDSTVKQPKLNQNYPNPFNPATRISYYLPTTSFVKLKIYNSIGEEIQTLVNQTQIEGQYELVFDGKDLSNGIYFYRLETDNYSLTKKMILLK